MNYYLKVLKNYAVFKGRARRKEYWMFVLFNYIVFFLIIVLFNSPNGEFVTFYALAVIIPSVSVGVRRLHDVGKSGWFMLISLVPIIGSIWLLVLLCTDGDSEDNEYGSNPKKDVRIDSELNTISKRNTIPYVGEYKNDKMHGEGTYTYDDGSKYVGEFNDGNFHGQGTMTYADGDKYVGELKNGNFYGQGTMTYADGSVEKGQWENDKFLGN